MEIAYVMLTKMRRGRFTHVEADGCDISEINIVLKPVPLLSLENISDINMAVSSCFLDIYYASEFLTKFLKTPARKFLFNEPYLLYNVV